MDSRTFDGLFSSSRIALRPTSRNQHEDGRLGGVGHKFQHNPPSLESLSVALGSWPPFWASARGSRLLSTPVGRSDQRQTDFLLPSARQSHPGTSFCSTQAAPSQSRCSIRTALELSPPGFFVEWAAEGRRVNRTPVHGIEEEENTPLGFWKGSPTTPASHQRSASEDEVGDSRRK